jgi:hypothetical protein
VNTVMKIEFDKEWNISDKMGDYQLGNKDSVLCGTLVFIP